MNNYFSRVLLCGFSSFVQIYGQAQHANDWVDFGKEYYKISVAAEGAYRLTYADLQNAGFPVNSVDPRRIQLFHRGQEQAIIVQGQADAQFDPSDFIEFYGRKNDGTNDTGLYSSANLQPHTYFNLYSDTVAYFLTWSQGLVQGKRMANFSEINVSGIPEDNYHFNDKLIVYANEYSTGNTISGVLQYTQFDEGEGWTGSTICIGNSGCTGQLDNTITNLSGSVVSGGNPQLELLLVGRDALSHLAEVYVGPNSGSLRLLTTENFTNYQTKKINLPIDWTDLSGSGDLIVRVKALGVGGARDRISVSYIRVVYPQDFNMASQPSKWFMLQANPSAKSYIEITNPPAGLTLWDISDLNNIITLGTNSAGSNISAVVPNTLESRKLFAKNAFVTPSVKRISFREIVPTAHNYIIVSNKELMKPALGYADPVKAYGGYRSTTEGGGYDTLIVTMDQLYNQFNYGENSASAIYAFMKFMVENGNPEYLFLIGKGLNVSQGFFRKTTLGLQDFKDLVPSAGMPGGDMAFTAGLGGTSFEPAVPTGRITASTPEQVASYLNKIIETEALPFNELWRKEVLHLSGGIQAFELDAFKQFMNGFGEVAKGPYYGGKVKTIAKQEPSPVELINVSEEVNNGVNLITFFGHSSPSTIDIDIGFATDPVMGYNNPGKYPSFLINGCNAGVFFSNFTVFGEDWVLAANKGARNFIAHSSFGFVNTLRTYTQLFYEVGFGDSTFIRTGIGNIQKEVARRYLTLSSPSIATVTQIQQMMLLGDPAVKLFGALKPDFETNDNSIFLESFDDNPVSALSDSFAIKIIARNFGSVSKAPLGVRVTRTFNDNTTFVYDSTFLSPAARDTLAFIVRRDQGTSGFGANQFLIELDYENKIEELNEENNSGLLDLFIPLSGTKNLIPYPFSVVNKSNGILKFQNTNLISELRLYDLEIDTLNTFDSPFLQLYQINGKVLMEQSISLLAKDSLAYYWRTKLADPLPGENAEWNTTSFTFIQDGEEGWAQVHFPQLEDNPVNGLIKNSELRQLSFEETTASVFVNNFGSAHPSPSTTSLQINNIEYNLSTQGQPCRTNTINFVAFDKTTLIPYAGIPFIFQDPRTCGRTPQVINSFTLSEMETGNNDDIIQMIDNVSPSDSVVIFSIGNADFASWPANVVTKIGELGIADTQLSDLQAGEPVVIFAKKGSAPGAAVFETTEVTPENEQALQVSKIITGKFTTGTLTSTLIGPAESWNKFTFYLRDINTPDIFSYDIIGINILGGQSTLLTGVQGSMDLTSISAEDFPWLKVVLNTTDEIDQTPVQMHQWLVNYIPAAEGILFYDGSPEPIVRQEGEPWSVDFSFINISDKVFTDDLQVHFDVVNKLTLERENQIITIPAPLPGDSTHFSFDVDTFAKTGLNDVNVRVNNRILPEQFYENNTLELINYLNVERDIIEPVLDVTIDGRYLIDGDFVSSNPSIVAKIWDENKFVLKTDTTGIRLLLKFPCIDLTCNFSPIFFTNNNLSWSPATAESDFTIDYKPVLTEEGEYTLRIEVADGSGNQTESSYQIRFTINQADVVNFFEPYPNPSSGIINYGFSISGNQAPEGYVLTVFGLDGRVIKEFRPEDSGLHVGFNQLVWDGQDETGIVQNAGMYLFRLTVTSGGRSFSKNGKVILTR